MNPTAQFGIIVPTFSPFGKGGANHY